LITRICLLFAVLTSFALSQSPIPVGAKVEVIATGFTQPEGPVWKTGVGLLFSDIAKGTIWLWSPSDSTKKVYLKPSDSSNGLTFDRQGNLILTQMQKRRISRQESNGTITPLVSTYNGKKLNSPNDVVVKSDGSIFFTDPDFNIPSGQQKELSIKGVYRLSPAGILTVLDSVFDKPNGICFSPDEKKLYVNESPQGKIYSWDVVNDSTIANKKLLYTIPTSGYADGMKTDSAGNIYCTGPTGVWIVSPTGTYLDRIAMTIGPSNCAWGDADKKTLYITGGTSLYRIRLAKTTGIKNEGYLQPDSYKLYGNYPNPFNPSTMINYQLPTTNHVTLKIYDTIGREIATLVNEVKEAGLYNVQLSMNTEQLSSGIYFYRLKAGNFSATKKLVLLK
jgi:gluconolactonase